MSIQFKCPSCSQPIEVDEDHAQTQVICYYCSNVITVPDASTLTVQDLKAGDSRPLDQSRPVFTHISQQQDAPALQQVSQQQSGQVQEPPPPDPGARQRTLTIVSISCGLGCLAVFMITSLVLALSLPPEITTNYKLTMEERLDLMQEHVVQSGKTHMMAFSNVAILIMALAGSICGLAALLRRPAAKRMIWIGFLLSAAFLLCQCAGFLMTISAGLARTVG